VREQDATAPLAFVAAADGAYGEREEPRAHTLARVARSLVHDHDAELEAADSLSGMKQALGEVPLAPAYAFVDGAARAWPDRDAAERSALSELVANETPLTAITAAMGHLGAATAVVQAIALGELLRRGSVPPITGLGDPAAGPLVPSVAPNVSGSPTPTAVALALSTGAPGLAAALRVEVAR
jgi:3-oxoacyl-(acyl-carrier-protein) synthase